jgi:glutamine synthetase type III
MKENYLKVIEVEAKSFTEIINKNIIPKCYEKINKCSNSSSFTHIKRYV